MSKELYIGLISGTSMDAVDCALIEISNDQPAIVLTTAIALPVSLKTDLMQLCANQNIDLSLLGKTDLSIARLFAEAVNIMLRDSKYSSSDIRAIGSHGQTIWHEPPCDQSNTGFSIQIGDPNTIAELTGITTVADFRRRDMAAGGQGAPIVPALHQALFQNDDNDRFVLNLGGIANITYLPCNGTSPLAMDTGPANVLMNIWSEQELNEPYDKDGAWASTGSICEPLLQSMLSEEYFSRPAPKSTGRELFNHNWLQKHLDAFDPISTEDVQATLLALTAETVSREILVLHPGSITDSDVLVCGGGARNKALMGALRERLPGFRIQPSDDFGISADYVEAFAFAWFASRTLQGKTLPLKDFTGARHNVIAGAVYFA